nr:succinate dehydrogenase/fumarate reductase iron-sulfur subunit [Actinomycetales bacterium]
GFGPCSNYGECAKVCPAGIPLSAIAAVNKERLRAGFQRRLA